MSKMKKVKELLQKVLASFGQVSTNKGIVAWSGDGELPEVGDSVHGIDEEGNDVPLEDGEYALESGVVIVIKDGRVEEIKDPNDEPAAEEEPESEPEPEVEPEPESEPEEGDNTENLEEEPAVEPEANPMEERIAALEALVSALEERLAALESKPLAPSASEEFRSINKVSKTGDEKMDKLMKILQA